MRTTNEKFFLDLKFRDATRSHPIVECLERNYAVTRVKRGVDAWVRVELDDVRKADALRRFGSQHGFDVKVAA